MGGEAIGVEEGLKKLGSDQHFLLFSLRFAARQRVASVAFLGAGKGLFNVPAKMPG